MSLASPECPPRSLWGIGVWRGHKGKELRVFILKLSEQLLDLPLQVSLVPFKGIDALLERGNYKLCPLFDLGLASGCLCLTLRVLPVCIGLSQLVCHLFYRVLGCDPLAFYVDQALKELESVVVKQDRVLLARFTMAVEDRVKRG